MSATVEKTPWRLLQLATLLILFSLHHTVAASFRAGRQLHQFRLPNSSPAGYYYGGYYGGYGGYYSPSPYFPPPYSPIAGVDLSSPPSSPPVTDPPSPSPTSPCNRDNCKVCGASGCSECYEGFFNMKGDIGSTTLDACFSCAPLACGLGACQDNIGCGWCPAGKSLSQISPSNTMGIVCGSGTLFGAKTPCPFLCV